MWSRCRICGKPLYKYKILSQRTQIPQICLRIKFLLFASPAARKTICAICVICERFHTPYPYSRRVRSPILATAVPDMAGQTWKYLFNYSIGGVQLTRFLELSLREF